MKRALVALVALVSLAACSSSQDPGIPGPQRAGTTGTTGDPAEGTTPPTYLYPPRCPEGGPNSTTPAAGCLQADGTLVRP